MIRQCNESDFEEIYEIINDAAEAYRRVIPDDCWHEPYMGRDELLHEIEDEVIFWGIEDNTQLNGIMGIQNKGEVTLIRHAYVRTGIQKKGVGTRLLRHFESVTDTPILIGTWAVANWAISFYQKNGYQLLSEKEKTMLLKKYWSVPDRQIKTSVVLADPKWTNGHT